MAELEAATWAKASKKRIMDHDQDHDLDQYREPSTKRRAKYALQACDACKRRKGRCDGQQPCQHCQKRAIPCRYESHPQLIPSGGGTTDSPNAKNIATVALTLDEVYTLQNSIKKLQKQLDEITTHVGSQAGLPPPSPKKDHALEAESSFVHPVNPILSADYTKLIRSIPRFHGSSTSEYSLNTIQLKLRQRERLDESAYDPKHHNLEETISTEEELNTSHFGKGGDVFREPSDVSCTVPAHKLLRKVETIRLLHVYQEVVGDLYPILDMQSLSETAEKLYHCEGIDLGLRAKNLIQVDEEDILLLNLVCSIALAAETTGKSSIAQVLYQSVQGTIQTNIIGQEIESIYHFYNDDIRLAWRLCGVAGRMIMEIGIHCWEIFERMFESRSQRDTVSSIVWTIVVLDRQWSCSLGIPQNFRESDFDKRLPAPEHSPYLKAMLTYGLLNPMYWDSTHRKIATTVCGDEDSFQYLTFDVERWRKGSLNGLNLIHPHNQEDAENPPAHTIIPILLNLRANQLRILLLRQLFASNSNLAINITFAEPSLKLAMDTVSVLYDVNQSSGLYQKQLPVFRHFLASSISLILMVITNKAQSQTSLSSEMWSQFLPSETNEVIIKAVQLATAYADSSPISRQLWERLVSILESLSRLRIIQGLESSPFFNKRGAINGDTVSNRSVIRDSASARLRKSSQLSSVTDNELQMSSSTEERSELTGNTGYACSAMGADGDVLIQQQMHLDIWNWMK